MREVSLIHPPDRSSTTPQSHSSPKNLSPSLPTDVVIILNTGSAAKDYAALAKREHLEPMQLLLRKVEDELITYHENVITMRRREEKICDSDKHVIYNSVGTELVDRVSVSVEGGLGGGGATSWEEMSMS